MFYIFTSNGQKMLLIAPPSIKHRRVWLPLNIAKKVIKSNTLSTLSSWFYTIKS